VETSSVDSEEDTPQKTPLSMSINELSVQIGGKGRALSAWDCFRIGVDPIHYYSKNHHTAAISETILNNNGMDFAMTKSQIQSHLPSKRKTEGLGTKALNILSSKYPISFGIEPSLGTIEHVQQSSDGTTKLLLHLPSSSSTKQLYVETVIIPWNDRQKSTLCVSSQVGCRQGCTFCATGKMGKLYDLSADEILIQLYQANKVCRLLDHASGIPVAKDQHHSDSNSLDSKSTRIRSTPSGSPSFMPLYPIDNIVFMGMGEPSDNTDAVIKAAEVMADKQCFSIPQSKITISTVGPNPECFGILSGAPAVLAFSVHAARDELRKKLVPTTKYTMEELRNGLVRALLARPRKLRATMLEVTLLQDVNDGPREAREMADLALSIMNDVPGMKLIVNLIPWNEIYGGGTISYKTSSRERVLEYQSILKSAGVLTYIRTTRGDKEDSACGQLTTRKRNSK